MSKLLLPTASQIAFGAAYSAIFPLTNLAGGGLALAGIAVTLPFLSLAWVGGMAMVRLVGNEEAYLMGAFITIFVQVLLVLFAIANRSAKRATDAT